MSVVSASTRAAEAVARRDQRPTSSRRQVRRSRHQAPPLPKTSTLPPARSAPRSGGVRRHFPAPRSGRRSAAAAALSAASARRRVSSIRSGGCGSRQQDGRGGRMVERHLEDRALAHAGRQPAGTGSRRCTTAPSPPQRLAIRTRTTPIALAGGQVVAKGRQGQHAAGRGLMPGRTSPHCRASRLGRPLEMARSPPPRNERRGGSHPLRSDWVGPRHGLSTALGVRRGFHVSRLRVLK